MKAHALKMFLRCYHILKIILTWKFDKYLVKLSLHNTQFFYEIQVSLKHNVQQEQIEPRLIASNVQCFRGANSNIKHCTTSETLQAPSFQWNLESNDSRSY